MKSGKRYVKNLESLEKQKAYDVNEDNEVIESKPEVAEERRKEPPKMNYQENDDFGVRNEYNN